MSQDKVADALNQIMNAKRAGQNSIEIVRQSKLLIEVLELAKKHKYIDDVKTEENTLKIQFSKLNKCQAIKPRYYVKKDTIEKYIRRYLPAKDFGIIIVSTNQGLMTNTEADEKKIGGCLIAYFY